ncbi:MAG: TIGR02757 family protein [Bacteroidetes bacterium]|nr:TIGR02757 family protein [Bacteroidota bacterium]
MRLRDIKTKKLLDALYKKYNIKESSKDPVWNLNVLPSFRDKEMAAFIISCYSYGNVKQIDNFVRKVYNYTGYSLYDFVKNIELRDAKNDLDFRYRFNTNEDFFILLSVLKHAVREYGSLKGLFLSGYTKEDTNIIPALTRFGKYIRSIAGESNTFGYLVPDAGEGSACKRLNLFLRWMVRKDNVDYGLWSEVGTSKLLMPVDIHVYRQSQKLKLVKRRTCDLKYAVELTEKLKEFDKDDPVKYDFALCHVGMESVNS